MDYSYGTKDCSKSASMTRWKSWWKIQLRVGLIILGLESLLHYSTHLDLELLCSNGWASQLRRLRLIWNNWEGVLNQWSQEVAIERVPRPNWMNMGCSNLMTDGPSVKPLWGLAIPHHKPVQAENCAATDWFWWHGRRRECVKETMGLFDFPTSQLSTTISQIVPSSSSHTPFSNALWCIPPRPSTTGAMRIRTHFKSVNKGNIVQQPRNMRYEETNASSC